MYPRTVLVLDGYRPTSYCGSGKAGKLGFVIRFHDLRGTHGTLLLDIGIGVHTVAARLGYDSAVLLKNYAKRTKTGDSTAADIIGAMSKNVLG